MKIPNRIKIEKENDSPLEIFLQLPKKLSNIEPISLTIIRGYYYPKNLRVEENKDYIEAIFPNKTQANDFARKNNITRINSNHDYAILDGLKRLISEAKEKIIYIKSISTKTIPSKLILKRDIIEEEIWINHYILSEIQALAYK